MNVAAKLAAFINQRKCSPFKWGENDCCLFVADWVLFSTGNDVASDFRGKYQSEKGAFKQLFKQGLNNVESVFKDRLNPAIALSYARRGDIAVVEFKGEYVGGIVTVNAVVCVGENGLVTLPMGVVKTVYPLEVRNV
ncbi:DUF6950 family protein [Pseudoalteromonas sp. 1_2015MBL_MicDiv]|uniref:DUF6950 family protein n=1 Tax=Pseudoalteromonas sp. 1_2015MBL_MicDiv TaxID=1720343 RepID=UPI000BBF2DD8|nr:hypothetical protein [Pseudoalteromonas sp. 1_2015MBL_MicDiv]ATG77658.1 hypothetical protein AOR04_08980 [Pseudoalteromonas sp. 1_2015MBL_MicDiv]